MAKMKALLMLRRLFAPVEMPSIYRERVRGEAEVQEIGELAPREEEQEEQESQGFGSRGAHR